ncbi:MAG: pseudouridine synthase [Myxococcales bacterium]|nr:pseudouridine synthase [Myxococcales bacterium]
MPSRRPLRRPGQRPARPTAPTPSRPAGPATVLLLNKPYDVLCQFTDARRPPGPDGQPLPPRPTLADYVDVPGVYAAGRLDRDSEGLLVLTDDGGLQHRLSHPKFGKQKGYWVQVEGAPTPAQLAELRAGVVIQGQRTQPCRVQAIAPPDLPPRDPPIRVRQTVPDAWLELWIGEGKNRQVRRMTAAVGLPTLRLVRFAVGPYTLGDLAPGQWRRVDPP